MRLFALAGLLLLQPPQIDDGGRFRVEIGRTDDQLTCSVVSHDAPLYEVLREIAERADLDVDGYRSEWRKLLVSAELDKRPLRQVLDRLLGSVELSADLRQGAIYVHPVTPPASAEDSFEHALAAYQRALRDFPTHAQCAMVMQRLAEIEEQRGDAAAARARYEALVERFPDSDLVPEALVRVARLLCADDQWEAARLRFEELLRFSRPHGFEQEARVELARCLSRTNEGERGLDLLDQLDALTPARTLEASIDRRLIRTRCLVDVGSGTKALELLGSISVSKLGDPQSLDYLELEARASEATDDLHRASRAWLSYARTAAGEERAFGLREAARLALDSGDELGALFVARLADRESIRDDELQRIADDSRVRLRVELPIPDETTLRQRLERGERLLDAGLGSDAFDAFRSIAGRANDLEPDLRLRFALAYGRALAEEINVDAALALWRELVPTLTSPDARRQIYVFAGELLERAGRLDEAVEAYRGTL